MKSYSPYVFLATGSPFTSMAWYFERCAQNEQVTLLGLDQAQQCVDPSKHLSGARALVIASIHSWDCGSLSQVVAEAVRYQKFLGLCADKLSDFKQLIDFDKYFFTHLNFEHENVKVETTA